MSPFHPGRPASGPARRLLARPTGWRLRLVVFLIGGPGLGGFTAPCSAVDCSRPNIVLIVADDLGIGDVGCFGASDVQTPAIDRIARQGLRFTAFYANSSVCSPTRASLLSGCYPERVGVPGVIRTHPEDSWGWLSPDAVLLPSVLKQADYESAMIGKWHLGLDSSQSPSRRGFDHVHGFLGDMMDDYYTHLRHGRNYMRENGRMIEPAGHATDLFAEWACAWLDGRTSQDQPFFLYLAFNAPHTPIQPPELWQDRIQAREPGMTPRRAALVALIEHMDQGIGRVLETLDRNGQANNTLVVFVSDNGGQLNVGANNGPWRDGKQSMYEGGLRVPACARWPGVIPAGRRSEQPCLTMDWFPTLCAVAGVSPSGPVDGVNLQPILEDPGRSLAPRDLFFHRREGNRRFGGLTIQAMRRGDWKLLQNSPYQPLELYHLGEDPGEQRDLAGSRPPQLEAMSAALRKHIQRGGAVPWQPPDHR